MGAFIDVEDQHLITHQFADENFVECVGLLSGSCHRMTPPVVGLGAFFKSYETKFFIPDAVKSIIDGLGLRLSVAPSRADIHRRQAERVALPMRAAHR
jgi:hypothetical protein